ncbi:penicillin-binding protein activator LpoB [Verrucomicrobiota bacterium]
MKTKINFMRLVIILSSVLILSGCAMFRTRVKDDDVNNMPQLDARYGPQDLRRLSKDIATEIAKSSFMTNQQGAPIMIIYGVQPRTTTFVDTKALTDRIRTTLTRSGKIQFVNEARRKELMKEQGFQAQSATDDTRTVIGKQLGARYMLTGALVEMRKQTGAQVRVSKTELMYYQLTIDITDLETGIVAWSTQKEFAREKREPLIGW